MNFKNKRRKTVTDVCKQLTPIVCLTAYTKPIAQIVDKLADIILVGDSLGTVLYGFKSTREVTSQIMINHAKSVVLNTSNACIIVDIPYQAICNSPDKTYKNVSEILTKSGACAVKLEGGENMSSTIKYLVKKKINVMGHVGMLPQSILKSKDYRVYGRTYEEKNQIFKDLKIIQDSGVFAVVIEATLESLVRKAIKKINIPTIGIGASKFCSGQIMVTEDLIGLTNFKAKFVKNYCNISSEILKGLETYKKEVKTNKFPSSKYWYK